MAEADSSTDIVKGTEVKWPVQGSACSAGLRGANLTQPSDTQLLYQRTLLLPHIVPFLPLQMSHHPSASTLPHNFDAIFNRALDTYKKRTKQDLQSHIFQA